MKAYLSEYAFEFKTNIDKQEELVIPVEKLLTFREPIVMYLLVPKLDYQYNSISNHGTRFFNKDNQVKVTAHSGMEKLEAFNDKEGQLKKGDFKYYTVTLEKLENFTIFLSVHTGKMVLVMNEEFGNLPT